MPHILNSNSANRRMKGEMGKPEELEYREQENPKNEARKNDRIIRWHEFFTFLWISVYILQIWHLQSDKKLEAVQTKLHKEMSDL